MSDLLREHGLIDANSTLAPIGADCYEVQLIDSALLEATSANGAPTIKDFQLLVGSLLWVLGARDPTLRSPSTRRRDRCINRGSTIRSSQSGWLATSRERRR